MATSTGSTNLTGLRDVQRPLAVAFGVVLVVLGAVDFLGVVTVDGRFGGLFSIPVWVNVIHVLTGLLGVVVGRYAGGGALFNKLGGVIYLLVFVIGSVLTLVGVGGVNWWTNGLHLVLAVVVGGVGFGIGEWRPR